MILLREIKVYKYFFLFIVTILVLLLAISYSQLNHIHDIQALIYANDIYKEIETAQTSLSLYDIKVTEFSAVYTPYNIVPGGGEKYLLSVVSCFQKMGFFVIIYVNPSNFCQTKECVISTADKLRVTLDSETFNVSYLSYAKFRPRPPTFFFALGNSRLPDVSGIGVVNIYMCQFPFDLDAIPSSFSLLNIQTYHIVILNSRFSLHWYNHFFSRDVLYLDRLPVIAVVYPPCVAVPSSDAVKSIRILLVGRFFKGRQGKGHDIAIKALSQLKSNNSVSDEFHNVSLTLVGEVMIGHHEYINELQQLVDDLGLSDSVEIIPSASDVKVVELIQSSLIFWHLTGLDADENVDPASREHFGISIVEAMTGGCIPIAVRGGGPDDIILHGQDGFLIHSLDDLVQTTKQILRKPENERNILRSRARINSKRFLSSSFEKEFQLNIMRMLQGLPFRHFVLETSLLWRKSVSQSPPSNIVERSDLGAVIFESRMHYALETVLLNVVRAISFSKHKWSVSVFSSDYNSKFIHQILARNRLKHLVNVVKSNSHLLSDYNLALKTPLFWDSLQMKKVLMVQCDSFILNTNIDDFIMFDYVGAPWHLGNERIDQIFSKVPMAVGNGGFSFRDVQLMKTIALKYSLNSPPLEHEDLFFAGFTYLMKKNISSREHAYIFCLEVPCNELNLSTNHLFALHAAWFYMKPDQALFHLRLSLSLL